MDEEADLALLDQHLLKTNLLSQRMTGILGQLDTRLSRLDKTIAPLGLQPLTRKAANIELAILALNGGLGGNAPPVPAPRSAGRLDPSSGVANAQLSNVQGYSLKPSLSPIASAAASGINTPADETAILTRGPDIMSLGEFFASMDSTVADLERMWKGFQEGRGGAREAGIRDLSKLVEVGFQGLTQLFLKVAREGMPRSYDLDQLLASGPPTPPNYFPPLTTLLPISTYLTSLMNPKSGKPRTQSLLGDAWQRMIAEYGEARGDWMKRSLGVMVSRVDEIDEGGIWEGGKGREKVKGLVGMWDAMLVLIEAETLLITTLFPSSPPPLLLQQTLSQPMSLLSGTVTPVVNTIKRALSSHVFIALDLYQSLVRLAQRWDTALQKCFSMTSAPTSSDTRNILGAHQATIATLRQLSMRSFPELLVDIRTAGAANKTPTVAISDTTYSTLTYLETLPAYEKTVEGLLTSSQSQRSWLMGAKDTPSPVRSAQDEGGVVNLFVADVLGTLIIHFNTRATPMRRPINQTFLLNNLSHIRNTTSSYNSDIIGPGAEDMLNKAFRDAKTQYLGEWQHLSSLLTSSAQSSTPRFVPGSNSERQQLKDGATSFFDQLAELENVCGQYPLNRQDPDMRDRIGDEVEDLVVGAYRTFVGRTTGKNVEKYLRGTPEEVGRRVRAIFR